ncbi:MAG: hypothetical protein WD055_03645 [Candidatus Dependentiae bacterium]
MKHSLLFIVFFTAQAAECNLPKILRTTHAILKKNISKKTTAGTFSQFKKTEQSKSDDALTETLSSLEKLSAHLHSYRSMLMLSATLFLNTPGYIETLRLVTDTHNEIMIKGHAYEIERAISLYEENETIKHFNKILTDGTLSREIDIQTDEHMVECKNITWHQSSSKLKKQFIEQQALVEHYNQVHDCNCIYQVSSKQTIPHKWKIWLIQQNIEIHEETI